MLIIQERCYTKKEDKDKLIEEVKDKSGHELFIIPCSYNYIGLITNEDKEQSKDTKYTAEEIVSKICKGMVKSNAPLSSMSSAR